MNINWWSGLIKEFFAPNADAIKVGIFTGCIVAPTPYLLAFIFNFIRGHFSKYSGYWEQRIFNNGDEEYQNEIVKLDYYKIKYYKPMYSGKLSVNVKGKIRRDKPYKGKKRKWNVIGYFDGSHVLTMIYLAEEGQASRGCIYMYQTNKTDYEFHGFYLACHDDSGQIEKTPLILTKVTDKSEIKRVKKLFRF